MKIDPPDIHTPLPLRDPTQDASRNHYWSYHSLPALLACKQPLTASPDEDLFIAVHQVCEISFHQMVIDLERTLQAWAVAMTDPADGVCDDLTEAAYFLQRVVRLWRTVNVTMPVLADLRGFAQFRTSIGPTSGFQSLQFRHIEILSGVGRRYWQGGTADAQGQLHVAETEFDRLYGAQVAGWIEAHRAHSLAHWWRVWRDRVAAAPTAVQAKARAQAAPLLALLKDFDTAQSAFHQSHLHLAVVQLRKVGVEVGTGGTSFKDYLARYGREVAPLFEGLTDRLPDRLPDSAA
jgi:tryptophan 2,3-dioxygenase